MVLTIPPEVTSLSYPSGPEPLTAGDIPVRGHTGQKGGPII